MNYKYEHEESYIFSQDPSIQNPMEIGKRRDFHSLYIQEVKKKSVVSCVYHLYTNLP